MVQVINFENFFIFDFLNHADSNGMWDCYPQTHGLVRNSKMGPDQSLQDSQVFQELIPDVVWVNKDSSHVVTQVVGITFKTKVDVN